MQLETKITKLLKLGYAQDKRGELVYARINDVEWEEGVLKRTSIEEVKIPIYAAYIEMPVFVFEIGQGGKKFIDISGVQEDHDTPSDVSSNVYNHPLCKDYFVHKARITCSMSRRNKKILHPINLHEKFSNRLNVTAGSGYWDSQLYFYKKDMGKYVDDYTGHEVVSNEGVDWNLHIPHFCIIETSKENIRRHKLKKLLS